MTSGPVAGSCSTVSRGRRSTWPRTRLRLAARGFAAIAAHDAAVAGFLADVPDDATGPIGPRPRQPRLLVGPGGRALTDVLAAPPRSATGALYQPAGSPRDQEVMAAADRLDLAMVVTGLEHLRR